MQMMHFIFALFKDIVSSRHGHHTRDTFMRLLAWSLMSLYEGEWPWHCPNGHVYAEDTPEGARARTPLCGNGSEKYCAVLFANEGDLEFHWQGFGLENPNRTREGPCIFCRCNSSTRSFTDYSDGAAWAATIYNKATWREHHPHPNRLYLLPFVSIHNQVCDWMHTNHLGNYQRIFASVLHLLVYELNEGTPTNVLLGVVKELKARLRVTRERSFHNISLKMFTNPDKPHDKFPLLKGKAAEVKHLTNALLSVWTIHSARAIEAMDAADPLRAQRVIVYGQIRLLLRCLSNMENILDKHDPVTYPKLPPDACREFQQHGNNALKLITAIGTYYIETEPRNLFNTTVKTHYLKHIILRARIQNPRLGWCYMPED